MEELENNNSRENANEDEHKRIEYYSNKVAASFKDWNRNVYVAGIITIIIIAIASILIKSLTLFVIGLVLFTFIILGALILLAIAEIIQKLQNIEDNTRK